MTLNPVLGVFNVKTEKMLEVDLLCRTKRSYFVSFPLGL